VITFQYSESSDHRLLVKYTVAYKRYSHKTWKRIGSCDILEETWKSHATEVRILKALVRPVSVDRCDSWNIQSRWAMCRPNRISIYNARSKTDFACNIDNKKKMNLFWKKMNMN